MNNNLKWLEKIYYKKKFLDKNKQKINNAKKIFFKVFSIILLIFWVWLILTYFWSDITILKWKENFINYIIMALGAFYSVALLIIYLNHSIRHPDTDLKKSVSAFWYWIINNYYIFFIATIIVPHFLTVINDFYWKWFVNDILVIIYFLVIIFLFLIKSVSNFFFNRWFPHALILLLPLFLVIWELESKLLSVSILYITIIYLILFFCIYYDLFIKNLLLLFLQFAIICFFAVLHPSLVLLSIVFVTVFFIRAHIEFKIEYFYNLNFRIFNILFYIFCIALGDF